MKFQRNLRVFKQQQLIASDEICALFQEASILLSWKRFGADFVTLLCSQPHVAVTVKAPTSEPAPCLSFCRSSSLLVLTVLLCVHEEGICYANVP